jgi:hypothetical protein
VRVILTPLAERHVDQLHEYITTQVSGDRADSYVSRIVEFRDILPGLRVAGFERRVTIAFVVMTDSVLIEGIYYGGQDFEAAVRDQT